MHTLISGRALRAALRGALLAVFTALGLSAFSADIGETKVFDVKAQSMDRALIDFSKQAGFQIVADSADVSKIQSKGVNGKRTVAAALEEMLSGTGLSYRVVRGDVITIERIGAKAKSENPTGLAQAPSQGAGASEPSITGPEREQIVVTGTNIRGVYPSSSPVQVYTSKDIERMGVTTIAGFLERLPQNLGTRTQYASGTNNDGAGNQNRDAVTGVDLRGLGPGTTLTLLNGRRLGASDTGRAVDVSMIPVSAIDRVEVLTDGASAIYGSDAIGGVVNFILRRDLDGAETQLGYGGVTSGALRQKKLFQAFGHSWGSGQAMLSYNFQSATPLMRADRDYAAPAGPGTLTPDEKSQAVFLTLTQHLGNRWTVSGDLGFTRREIETGFTSLNTFGAVNDAFITYQSRSDRSFVNLGVDYRIADTLNASIVAAHSENEGRNDFRSTLYNRNPPSVTAANLDSRNSVLDVTAKVDGTLFRMAGGAARFSVGGGVLAEELRSTLTAFSFPSGRSLGRDTTYAFGELLMPVFGEAQKIPFARSLELNVAGRYTRYDDTSRPAVSQDFGDSFDPKVGIMWAPIQSLRIRGTYGTSFRAPALTQIDPAAGATVVVNRLVANQPANVLTVAGFPAGNLKPETAETLSLGFDFRPQARPSLRLSGTYYRLEYVDRIAVAPSGQVSVTARPDLVPDVIYRAPSAAYIQEVVGGRPLQLVGVSLPGVNLADPAAVAAAVFALPNVWILDVRFRNLAQSKQSGIDLSAIDSFDTSWGRMDVGANITRILNYRQQGSQNSPVRDVVDFVGLPVSMRGRMYVGLTRGDFSGTLGINHTDSYKSQTVTGSTAHVASWTTADLALSYVFGDSGFLRGLKLNLSATNLFDKAPPLVGGLVSLSQVGFDSANANPLGRLVTLSATKSW